MAKFYGKIGYAVKPVETSPGVTQDVIIERKHFGDVLRNTRKLADGEYANNDISVGNSISVLAGAYGQNNFFSIRYVEWKGVLWTVTDVEVRGARLILNIGEVYNGPTPEAPEAP